MVAGTGGSVGGGFFARPEAQLVGAARSLAAAANVTFGDSAVRLLDGVRKGYVLGSALRRDGRQIELSTCTCGFDAGTMGVKGELCTQATSSLVRDAVNRRLWEFLGSKPQCPRSNFSDGHIASLDYPARGASAAFGVCAAVAAACALLAPKPRSACRASAARELEAGGGEPAEGGGPLSAQPVALWRHPAVPQWLQLSLPLAMVGCLCLFLVAATTPGVVVTASSTAGGVSMFSPSIANLSIDNCLQQMWSRRSYPVAIVLGVFSLFWPFAKLLLLLHAFMRPYPEELRGKMLFFLDQVGKWSLTDNFVLMLLCAFFYVAWSGPDVVSGDGRRHRL